MSILVKCVVRPGEQSEILTGTFDLSTGVIMEYPELLKVDIKNIPVDSLECKSLYMPGYTELMDILLEQKYAIAAIAYNGHYILVVNKYFVNVYNCWSCEQEAPIRTAIDLKNLKPIGVVRTKLLTFREKQNPALLLAEDYGIYWKLYLSSGIYTLRKSLCDGVCDFSCSGRDYWNLAEQDDAYGAVVVNGKLTPFGIKGREIWLKGGC